MTATYTAPKTMGAEPTIYSDWNTYVRDNIEFFKSKTDTYDTLIIGRAYKSATIQTFTTGVTARIELDAESFDTGSNFSTTTKTGSATSTSANHLVDTNATFVAEDVGKQVWNTTDNTYALVTVVNSGTDVTLDVNIMASGEGYRMFASQFVATVAGYYSVFYGATAPSPVDAKYHKVSLIKNTTVISSAVSHSGSTADIGINGGDFVHLDIGDKLSISYYHTDGANKTLYNDSTTFLAVKLERV